MRCGPFQLCCCSNAFPCEGIDAQIELFKKRLPALRGMVPGAMDKPFAAGLWLDSQSVSYLVKSKKSGEFCDFVKSLGFYAFTANAFPFGRFHDGPVKESVYEPDWSETDRLDYTCAVADILARLLPEGVEGSISTLPCGYKGMFKGKDLPAARLNLLLAANRLKKLWADTGRRITLAVEMEPDCVWECPEEFCDFYDLALRGDDASDFIGVCYDACHQELLNSAPGKGVGTFLDRKVKIAKFQLSAAILAPDMASKKTLEAYFMDTVYLHQTRAFPGDGSMLKWPDLPDALLSNEKPLPWKVHFHVPVFLEEIEGGLLPANAELLSVIERVKKEPGLCSNLEVETYSYNVLPDFSKESSIEKGMARELQWTLAKLGPVR